MTQILIDTNILLRSVEPQHAQHHESVQATDSLRRDQHRLVIVPQIVYEFWSVATRPISNNGLGMAVSEAEIEIGTIKRLYRLFRDERAIFERWERLVAAFDAKGKRAHDARLVAAMRRHSLANILTFNETDFRRYPDIAVWTPNDVLTGQANFAK